MNDRFLKVVEYLIEKGIDLRRVEEWQNPSQKKEGRTLTEYVVITKDHSIFKVEVDESGDADLLFTIKRDFDFSMGYSR